jgi:hypothetical protein
VTQFEQMMQRMRYELSLAANITRQEAAEKAIDYYGGKQLVHLDAVLSTQFSDPKSLKMQPAVDNITQFVTDEISRVFDAPPTMTCENAAGQALIDKLTADGVLFIVLKLAECYANITRVCALYPWWDEASKTIRTTPMPSSTLFVAQMADDPTQAEAVVFVRELLNTVSGQDTTQYVHWDSESHFVFDKAGVYSDPTNDSSNPDKLNPYGIIPFAWMRDSLAVGSFFGEMDETLVNAQETLNVLLTACNQLAKFQGFSQPVMTGIDLKTPIVVDPSRPIRIPPTSRDENEGRFEFVTPGSKIQDLLDAANQLIDRTLARHGISIQALKDGGKVLSGESQRVANVRLDRRREDCVPLANMCLQQWWRIVVAINNAHNMGAQVPPDAVLVVDFPEPHYGEDAAAALTNDKARIDLGLVSPVDLIMRDNPDLDKEQATAKYYANRAFTKSANARFGLAGLIAAPAQPKAPTDAPDMPPQDSGSGNA